MKAQSLVGKVTEIIHVVKTKAKNQDTILLIDVSLLIIIGTNLVCMFPSLCVYIVGKNNDAISK